MRSRSQSKFFLRVIFCTLFAQFLFSTPTFAHTKLISANPAADSTFEDWPSRAVLEFDDELQNLGGEKVNFVIFNNAVGDQVSETDEVINGNTLSVTLLPNAIKGQVLVYYRVVSTDGHPVEGEYSFSYGVTGASEQTVEPESEKNTVPVGIYLTSAIFIISGLFFSIYSYRRRSR